MPVKHPNLLQGSQLICSLYLQALRREVRVWAATGMCRLHAKKPFLNVRDVIAQDICGAVQREQDGEHVCSHASLYSLCWSGGTD